MNSSTQITHTIKRGFSILDGETNEQSMNIVEMRATCRLHVVFDALFGVHALA